MLTLIRKQVQQVFFTFALFWAINNGLLQEDIYIINAMKGWQALKKAINNDGMLGWVQPIGASPETVTQNMTRSLWRGFINACR